jgi:hypothetical protein
LLLAAVALKPVPVSVMDAPTMPDELLLTVVMTGWAHNEYVTIVRIKTLNALIIFA